MSTGTGRPPPRAVLGLTAAVLAAHLWLLHHPPRSQPAPAARPAAFNTRTIGAPAPAPAPAPLAGSQQPQTTSRPPAPPAAPSRQAAPVNGRAPAAVPAAAERAAGAVRVAIPASMRLVYQLAARVKQQTTQGTSELLWRHDGTSYEARFEVAMAGSRTRVQHSAGQLGREGLEPRRFGDRGRGEQAAHFDRESQRVVFSNNRPAAALVPGAQDRLSVLLQLAALVAGDPASYPAGAEVAIQTATTRDAEPWVFSVEGEEPLQLPGGDFAATLKLARPPRGEFDQRLEVWLAPGQAYAPVRLRLTQPNGDWVDHQWSATDRR